jgi:hypothetical protein
MLGLRRFRDRARSTVEPFVGGSPYDGRTPRGVIEHARAIARGQAPPGPPPAAEAPPVPSYGVPKLGEPRGPIPPGYKPPPAYGPALPSIAPTSSAPPNLQGSLDSSHRVEVHFGNAPPGMRSGLTKSEGPADIRSGPITRWMG